MQQSQLVCLFCLKLDLIKLLLLFFWIFLANGIMLSAPGTDTNTHMHMLSCMQVWAHS